MTQSKSRRWLPIVVLVLVISIPPELFSGNTPAERWLDPATLPFLIVAYGLPVLVIREVALRRSLGSGGVFCLGLAYGIVNEGLYAGTFFRQTGLPIADFDGYGYAFGINWPWAALMMTWHAVSSVWLPIALTNRAFGPGALLGRWSLLVVAVIACAAPTLFYLSFHIAAGLGLLAGQWAVMLGLAALALRFRGQPQTSQSRFGPFLLGFLGIIPVILVTLIAKAGFPLSLYFAVLAGLVLIWALILTRRHWASGPATGWFALGWYGAMVAFSALVLFARSPATVAADLVLWLALWLWVSRSQSA